MRSTAFQSLRGLARGQNGSRIERLRSLKVVDIAPATVTCVLPQDALIRVPSWCAALERFFFLVVRRRGDGILNVFRFVVQVGGVEVFCVIAVAIVVLVITQKQFRLITAE